MNENDAIFMWCLWLIASSGAMAAAVHVTFGAEIVHQNDLFEEVRRRPVEHTVHGADERGPNLVHETEDDAGGRQVVVDQILWTPGRTNQNSAQPHGAVGGTRPAHVSTHVSGRVSGMARSTGIWSLR